AARYALDLVAIYASTVIPMLRAVPAMIFSAASTVLALRSSCLVSAIWRRASFDSLPTFAVCGVAEPFATPAAFLMSYAAGEVLRMHVNDRSSHTVISSGMTLPRLSAVASLSALQISMMFTPRCPGAGLRGGAGLAAPA